MNQLFDKKESWEKGLMFLDVETSLRQIAKGRGIAHQDAQNIIMRRIHKQCDINTDKN